jgi:hypothetical protein
MDTSQRTSPLGILLTNSPAFNDRICLEIRCAEHFLLYLQSEEYINYLYVRCNNRSQKDSELKHVKKIILIYLFCACKDVSKCATCVTAWIDTPL